MKNIYININNEQKGPFEIDDLKSQKINKDTLVWFEGMTDWKKAGDMPELKELFTSIPPPILNSNQKSSSNTSDDYYQMAMMKKKNENKSSQIIFIVIGVIIFLGIAGKIASSYIFNKVNDAFSQQVDYSTLNQNSNNYQNHQQSNQIQNIQQSNFTVDVEVVKNTFLENFKSISIGRKLKNYYNANPETVNRIQISSNNFNGFRVFISDINQDNLMDGVVSYILARTNKEEEEEGNSWSGYAGIVVFLNNGNKLELLDYKLDSFRWLPYVINISNGIITTESIISLGDRGIDWPEGESEDNGSPGTEITTKFKLENNKIKEISKTERKLTYEEFKRFNNIK